MLIELRITFDEEQGKVSMNGGLLELARDIVKAHRRVVLPGGVLPGNSHS